MGKSRRSPKPAAKKSRKEPVVSRPAVPARKAQPTRSLFKDMIFGLVVCLVFFLVLEGGLRIVGFPEEAPAEDPFVGFSATRPLYQVDGGIATTAESRRAWFNVVSFPVTKPENTFRVFCFGGSTTYGHPFDGRTAFSRWLEELLKASVPGMNFEVINAGGISYASYRIVPLIRETLNYQPDLMIIYTGHNEFLERRTYEGMFDRGGPLVTVRSFLEDLRLYRALKKLLETIAPGLKRTGTDGSGRPSSGPGGSTGQNTAADGTPGKSLLTAEVSAVLDRSAGLELYHRDEEFTTGVVRHFAHNLDAMISLCRSARVPVFLVQPASNIRDFSPFKSEHGKSLSVQEKSGVEQQVNDAADLVKKGEMQSALSILDGAVRTDPLFAETHFWRGKALLGTGSASEAQAAFLKARDLDVCPLRCITPLEEKIDETAAGRGVPLIRFRESLERIAVDGGDKSGSPGNESFLDHVHPTIERYQLLAEQLVERMVELGMIKPSRTLNAEDRSAVYEAVMKSLDPQFFATKDLNLAKVLRWAGKKEESREVLKRVATHLPDNPEIHKMVGSFLLDEGSYKEAIDEYSKAVELSRHDPVMEFSLAAAYHRAGLRQDAQGLFAKLSRSPQTAADAMANLAMIYLEQGKVNEAQSLLEPAIKGPGAAEGLFAPYGLSLAMTGRTEEAINWTLRAIRAEPGNTGHLYNLAGMYASVGKTKEALAALNNAVDKGYARPDKMATDPVFASIRGLPEFSGVLDRMKK